MGNEIYTEIKHHIDKGIKLFNTIKSIYKLKVFWILTKLTV